MGPCTLPPKETAFTLVFIPLRARTANTFMTLISSAFNIYTENGSLDTFHSVRFEVFTAVTMKNAVFWGVKACGSCKFLRTSVL
jgi:hypothetical protein